MPLLFIIWLLLSWLIADQVMLSRSQQLVEHESIEIEQHARKLHDSVRQVVKQQHGTPQIVALNQEVVSALSAPTLLPQTVSIAERRQRWSVQFGTTNAYLSIVATSLGAQVVYIINTAGDCIASSNANQPDSFIGANYAERAYFKMPMTGQLGTQYAMGKISNIPGLFFSAPVYAKEKLLGVAVVKLNLSNLESFINPSDAFISDQYGVVILAADKQLEMRTLPDNSVSSLSPTQRLARYKVNDFSPINIAPWLYPVIPALHYFGHNQHPLVLSSPYRVEDDVNIHAVKYLPELEHYADDRLQLFIVLGLSGLILIGLAAWRLFILKNQRHVEQVLRESEARFRNMSDDAPALIWISDSANLGVWYNKSWLEYTGHTMEQELGIGWMESIHPDDWARCTAFHQSLPQPRHRFEVEYRLRRADGGYGWIADTATPYFDLKGKFQGYISYCWDIDQRKNTEEQIRHLAFYDSLTRLPNRRLLNDRLRQAMSSSKRDQRYGAVIFLDLDNFKPLNDTYGHGVGDMLLIEVAHRIAHCMREIDTVARFGGDEFVVVLSGLDADSSLAKEETRQIADKIRLALAEPYRLTFQQENESKHIEHRCTSSIGIVLFLGANMKQKDILRYADIAMYQAKEAGRNQFKFYE